MMAGEDTGAHAGLQIRVAVPADGDVIAARNCEMAYETEGRRLDPETAKQGALSLLKDPAKGWYLVAEYNGKVVGQCMITREWSDWRNGQYWWVQSVFIIPECRRKGVFSALYAWISGEAHRRQDVVGLRLYVEEENLAAREAYRSLGMKHAAYVMYEDIYGDTAKGTIHSRIAGSD